MFISLNDLHWNKFHVHRPRKPEKFHFIFMNRFVLIIFFFFKTRMATESVCYIIRIGRGWNSWQQWRERRSYVIHLNGTHQFLAYSDDMNLLGDTVNIKLSLTLAMRLIWKQTQRGHVYVAISSRTYLTNPLKMWYTSHFLEHPCQIKIWFMKEFKGNGTFHFITVFSPRLLSKK
jgi:hypothetical protein